MRCYICMWQMSRYYLKSWWFITVHNKRTIGLCSRMLKGGDNQAKYTGRWRFSHALGLVKNTPPINNFASRDNQSDWWEFWTTRTSLYQQKSENAWTRNYNSKCQPLKTFITQTNTQTKHTNTGKINTFNLFR